MFPTRARLRPILAGVAVVLALGGCGDAPGRASVPPLLVRSTADTPTTSTTPAPPPLVSPYPWHTGIAATTFWVGQVINSGADGSQKISTYDYQLEAHYGGCDGIQTGRTCQADPRTAANGFFPTAMTPKENPFYLDLPFDDVNNATAVAERDRVVPWAHQPGGATAAVPGQPVSLMKNHWVELTDNGRVCFGQVEDAGPEQYADANYVFGTHDQRPANKKINGAGLDVSPALNSCLGFSSYDSDQDRVDWRFFDAPDVPSGPWTKVVTTSPVSN